MAKLIDHTILKANATEEEITQLCREAAEYGFASVCINPYHVPLAHKLLADSGVPVCTVIGFPLGASATAVKAYETTEAVKAGAKEVDMVINIGLLIKGQNELVQKDIQAVVDAAAAVDKSAIVKVIIETSYLTDEQKVTACKLAKEAGAHFVKTSTGFSASGATVEDIRLMRQTVGPDIGVKASGGIRNTQQALAMVEAGASRIGASAGIAIIAELS
ncbi:MAG: deoxyribose-phosphate aldolase [Clostridia bacterium]|nr:deoxyribose-phosphate aldolase [Clostridia bacterium]